MTPGAADSKRVLLARIAVLEDERAENDARLKRQWRLLVGQAETIARLEDELSAAALRFPPYPLALPPPVEVRAWGAL